MYGSVVVNNGKSRHWHILSRPVSRAKERSWIVRTKRRDSEIAYFVDWPLIYSELEQFEEHRKLALYGIAVLGKCTGFV